MELAVAPDDRERVAADPGLGRLGDAEHGRGRERSVDRVAPTLERPHAGARRERVARGDHRVGRDRRRPRPTARSRLARPEQTAEVDRHGRRSISGPNATGMRKAARRRAALQALCRRMIAVSPQQESEHVSAARTATFSPPQRKSGAAARPRSVWSPEGTDLPPYVTAAAPATSVRCVDGQTLGPPPVPGITPFRLTRHSTWVDGFGSPTVPECRTSSNGSGTGPRSWPTVAWARSSPAPCRGSAARRRPTSAPESVVALHAELHPRRRRADRDEHLRRQSGEARGALPRGRARAINHAGVRLAREAREVAGRESRRRLDRAARRAGELRCS